MVFSGSDDNEFYHIFMNDGFSRLEVSEYQEASNNFNAAYELMEITSDQKFKALYHRNLSDSCKILKDLADNYYESGNFKMASFCYLKVYTYNSKDTESKSKYITCNKKIKNQNNNSLSSMVYVKGNSFIMGSIKGSDTENFEHRVELSSFFVDKNEVTNQEFANFLNEIRILPNKATVYIDLDDDDCKVFYKDGFYFAKSGFDNHPVVEISWFGANAFAKHYNKRLPTEAEWEFIAKSDLKSVYSDGYLSVLGGKANDLGIFNLYGNVREWCLDYYWENFYIHSPVENPLPINFFYYNEHLSNNLYKPDNRKSRTVGIGNLLICEIFQFFFKLC